MTVAENLRLGAFARGDDEIDRDLDYSEHAEQARLEAERRPTADGCSGQRLDVAALDLVARRAVARSRAQGPPGADGDPPQAFRVDIGLTVVLVEQDVPLALSIADRVNVLAGGRAPNIALEATPAALASGDELHRIYFGQ